MKPKPPFVTHCKQCGKQISLKAYLANKVTKHGNFCSKQCRSKFLASLNPNMQPHRVIVHCAHCGKELEMQPYRVLPLNFCDNVCRGAYGSEKRWANNPSERVKVSCAYCGNELFLPKWKLRSERNQEQHFCNRKCFSNWKSANWNLEHNPSWKGGWTPHGKGWELVCKQVRKEQNYKCADCGKSEKEIGKALDVHHMIPARLFKRKADASFRTNLVGLCHPCHMKREREIELL